MIYYSIFYYIMRPDGAGEEETAHVPQQESQGSQEDGEVPHEHRGLDIYIYIHTHAYTHSLSLSIYIYIYICVRIYIYIYIYTNIPLWSLWPF